MYVIHKQSTKIDVVGCKSDGCLEFSAAWNKMRQKGKQNTRRGKCIRMESRDIRCAFQSIDATKRFFFFALFVIFLSAIAIDIFVLFHSFTSTTVNFRTSPPGPLKMNSTQRNVGSASTSDDRYLPAARKAEREMRRGTREISIFIFVP